MAARPPIDTVEHRPAAETQSIPIPIPIAIGMKTSPDNAVEATGYRRLTADAGNWELTANGGVTESRRGCDFLAVLAAVRLRRG